MIKSLHRIDNMGRALDLNSSNTTASLNVSQIAGRINQD